MGDIVMLVAGAALVAIGVGMGSRQPRYDWLDSGRQKMVEDFGLSPEYRSVMNSFPINATRYEVIENSNHWSVAPEKSRRAYILNAADSDAMNEAAAYDITINNRRQGSKRYGVRWQYM